MFFLYFLESSILSLNCCQWLVSEMTVIKAFQSSSTIMIEMIELHLYFKVFSYKIENKWMVNTNQNCLYEVPLPIFLNFKKTGSVTSILLISPSQPTNTATNFVSVSSLFFLRTSIPSSSPLIWCWTNIILCKSSGLDEERMGREGRGGSNSRKFQDFNYKKTFT